MIQYILDIIQHRVYQGVALGVSVMAGIGAYLHTLDDWIATIILLIGLLTSLGGFIVKVIIHGRKEWYEGQNEKIASQKKDLEIQELKRKLEEKK